MKENKVSIFFIGGKSRGFNYINELVKQKENLVGALILKEDSHEKEIFYEVISKKLKKYSIPFLVTKSAKNGKYYEFIKKTKPSIIIVLGWRTLIPDNIIKLPPLGTVAVHESLLPKYRGFAPVNWALINGETTTGVTLFFLSKGMDNGDIIGQKEIKISPSETAQSVYEKTSEKSIELLKRYTPLLKKGKAPRKKQNEKYATFTCARIPEDGLINWHDTTNNIYNLIRGLSYPYPGAFTYINGKKEIINKASIPKQRNYSGRIPGRVVSIEKNKGVEILTGDGIILLEEIVKNNKIINPTEVITSIKATLRNKTK